MVLRSWVQRMTLLAPDISEGILDGRRPIEMALETLLKPFPAKWERQRVLLLQRKNDST
jgi:hypothetical protein